MQKNSVFLFSQGVRPRPSILKAVELDLPPLFSPVESGRKAFIEVVAQELPENFVLGSERLR